jgi:hypothetical protein
LDSFPTSCYRISTSGVRSLIYCANVGLAWPFYHIVKGSDTLIFGTKNWLGLNFGVLFAWAAISYALLPVSIWLELRRKKELFHKNRETARQQVREYDEKHNASG